MAVVLLPACLLHSRSCFAQCQSACSQPAVTLFSRNASGGIATETAGSAMSAAPVGAVDDGRNVAAADAEVEQITIAAGQQLALNPGALAPALDQCGQPSREASSL